MRRLAIALAVSLAALALLPAGAFARGPQKNDSASGHGLVVFTSGENQITYNFRFSAHTVSNTTTVATGNMQIDAESVGPTGITRASLWADVFCLSVVDVQAEIRGHVYRIEPSIGTPLDLVFNVDDVNSFMPALPDLFFATTNDRGIPCTVPPEPGTEPVAKGDIDVHDEPAF